MSKSDAFETAFLKLVYQGVAMAGLADNTVTAPVTNIEVALHTADPTDAGNQSSSELSYTGYARVPVARSAAGWAVAGNVASPVANITFAPSTGGTGGAATFFSTGVGASGATMILHSGPVAPTITVAAGVTPQLSTATTITED